MRNLTESEIKDLESRGIKEGEVYHCPYTNMPFTLRSWNDFETHNEGFADIASKHNAEIFSEMPHAWLRRGTDYATPVVQPSQPLWIPQPKPTPIDWEARRWELATRLFASESLTQAEACIESADSFIEKYQKTPMP